MCFPFRIPSSEWRPVPQWCAGVLTPDFPIDPRRKCHYVQQVLQLTCDMLPGDHAFSIYIVERKGPDNAVNRRWRVVNE